MKRSRKRAILLSLTLVPSSALADGLGGLSAARELALIFFGVGLSVGGLTSAAVCWLLVRKTGRKVYWWWLPVITLWPFLVGYLYIVMDICRRFSLCLF